MNRPDYKLEGYLVASVDYGNGFEEVDVPFEYLEEAIMELVRDQFDPYSPLPHRIKVTGIHLPMLHLMAETEKPDLTKMESFNSN